LLLAVAFLCVLFVVVGCAPKVVTSTSTSASAVTVTSAPATTSATTVTSVAVSVTQPQEPETTTTAGPQVIKIGALFPLTGNLASVGQSALKGMRLAVAEINQDGGIAALNGALLTLSEADSKGDANRAEAEVTRLVQTEGVAAIVGAGQSTVALDATDAAERFHVPFIVSSGAADKITGRGLAYTFRLCPEADWYARDQVAFLESLKDLAGLDINTVALLHENGEFGKQTAESERSYLAAAGIQVVADIEYSPEQADLHNEVMAIRQSGAQAILTATFLSDAASIAQAVAVLHLNLPIVDAAGGVLDPGFIADAGDSAERMMSVAEFAAGTAPGLTLGQKMTASGATLDAEMLYGYQAVWVLADALQRVGSSEGSRLRVALATTALYGDHLVLPQDLLTFDGTGQNRGARLLVVQVQGGRMLTVWPTEFAQATVLLP
jgi:branched-chain amino acid transport system substrate-binding protein